MPMFIALGKATEQGLANLDNLTGRHEIARRRARDLGGRVIGSYATLGQYDFVVMLDCPDLETCMRILSRESAGGNIRYETMPALPTRDFAQIFLDEQELAEERRVLRVGRTATKRAVKRAAAKKSPRKKASGEKPVDAIAPQKGARKRPAKKAASAKRRQ
jgi:uncharacterized protein with GYD domain